MAARSSKKTSKKSSKQASGAQGEPDWMELLDVMTTIRRFEEKAGQQYGLRKIGGFLHLYIGQEAVAVGALAALDMSKDYVLTSYRDHAQGLALGMSADSLMAELFGKATGCSKGKGGSMHFFDRSRNFMGGNGIVGAQIPVATGAGLKIKYRQEDGVVLCFFGDGAIHQGAFHESLNLAQVWGLPVVYICENNGYGMGTDFKRVSAETEFERKAASYGMAADTVNGMDIREVYSKVGEAVARGRKESMPTLLDVKTYRYVGHSISDPAKYRSKEEVQEYKDCDPIIALKAHLMEEGVLTDERFQEMDQAAKETAKKAVEYAEQSPQPEPEELYTDILV